MKLSRFLAFISCAALIAALVALPAVSNAQTKLRFQHAFPGKSVNAENAQYWADRVKVLSGGRLEIEFLSSGSVVPVFETLDGVHKKVIDGAHSSTAYWFGKNRAATLFGGLAPGGPFGMDPIDYLDWIYHGGGLELYRELYQVQLKLNVVPIPMTSSAHGAMGWFKRPIKNWADLKGLKCRQTGINAEVYSKSGMATVNMPGGEIVSAAERGVIDCAEFIGAVEDMRAGFHSVWKNFYPQGIQEPAAVAEIIFNGDVWKSLTPDLQAIVQAAAHEATVLSMMARNRQTADALVELTTNHGVTIRPTPSDILQKTLETWDVIAKAEAAKNPFFNKVYESQRAYASKVIPARRATTPPYNLAADYYWPEKK